MLATVCLTLRTSSLNSETVSVITVLVWRTCKRMSLTIHVRKPRKAQPAPRATHLNMTWTSRELRNGHDVRPFLDVAGRIFRVGRHLHTAGTYALQHRLPLGEVGRQGAGLLPVAQHL